MDLRDVVKKSEKNNIINVMDSYNDELLEKLVDELITNHIKDFISDYIEKELEYSGLEFDGDLVV